MSGALTVSEAFGSSLEDVLLQALTASRRPARSAVCPVCGGAMRRLAEEEGTAGAELVCGECESVLVDDSPPVTGQLRLVR